MDDMENLINRAHLLMGNLSEIAAADILVQSGVPNELAFFAVKAAVILE